MDEKKKSHFIEMERNRLNETLETHKAQIKHLVQTAEQEKMLMKQAHQAEAERVLAETQRAAQEAVAAREQENQKLVQQQAQLVYSIRQLEQRGAHFSREQVAAPRLIISSIHSHRHLNRIHYHCYQ